MVGDGADSSEELKTEAEELTDLQNIFPESRCLLIYAVVLIV